MVCRLADGDREPLINGRIYGTSNSNTFNHRGHWLMGHKKFSKEKERRKMRTAILTMLIILIAVTCYLGVAHWRDGHWGYVLLSIAFVLIFGAAIPDLLKKEKRGKQPTAEQLRDSDEQLYQDAQDQFFETKLHERVKFGAALFIAVLSLMGLLVYLIWAGN